MKKSTAVTLVLSGALIGGCDNRPSAFAGNGGTYRATPTITNNTFVAGQGYWHAPYQGWFPYPYNSYHEGFGYYHGGSFSETPEVSEITASAPADGSGLAAQGLAQAGQPGGNTTIITNNTYVVGMGYWHEPYHGWYPYPWNYYRPGFGYYHGGIFSSAPFVYSPRIYSPTIVSPGHSFGSSGGGFFGGSSHVSSISRGGFGGSSHSVGG